MFGAAMSQGVQALKGRPDVGAYNNDYYQSKQKDCQIIRVQSSDADIQVNCGNLRPNFTNAAAVTGAHMNDIYYCLKSFITPHRFYNAEVGMKLQLFIPKISWYAPQVILQDSNGQFVQTQIVDAIPSGEPIQLDLDIQGKQCLSEVEMVDYILEKVNELHQRLSRGGNAEPAELSPPTQRETFLDVFNHAQIAYMTDAKKMSVYVSPIENQVRSKRKIIKVIKSINITPQMTTNLGWAIAGFQVAIRVDPTMSQSFQLRMARMLGFTEEITYNYDGTTSIGNIFDFPNGSFIPFQAQSIRNYFVPGLSTKYWDDITAEPYRPNALTQAYYDSCKNIMQMVRYRRLYIRSSLQNNTWRGDGSKGDDLAVIPVTGDITKNIVLYEQPGGARTYEVKETTAGALSFSLRITDEHGELIEFIEDYELQLAFFYTPDGYCGKSF